MGERIVERIEGRIGGEEREEWKGRIGDGQDKREERNSSILSLCTILPLPTP